ncbi:MAG: sensor histidine kinase [Deltaproteobacteria bacterium]
MLNKVQSLPIATLIERKFRSLMVLAAVLLGSFSISFSVLVYYYLMSQISLALNGWIHENTPKIEEALFIKNNAAVEFRAQQINSLQPTYGNYSVLISDSQKQKITGNGKHAEELISEVRFSFRNFQLTFHENLFLGGKFMGEMSCTAALKPMALGLVILVSLFIWALSLIFLNNALRSLVFAVKTDVTEPIQNLHKSMRAFDFSQSQITPRVNPNAASEVQELYEGYDDLMKRAASSAEVEAKKKEVEATLKITSQVAHDIRSPLMALGVVTQDLSLLPKTHQSLILGAVNRITDICNSLVHARKELLSSDRDDSGIEKNLKTVLDNILAEKKILYRQRLESGLKLESILDGNDFVTSIDTLEFSRVVSNLIDNAVESVESEGSIEVRLRRNQSVNYLQVSDNGKGIPETVLEKLGRERVSFGKPKGLGLGLFHAHQTVEKWGGRINIESNVNQGTQITISVPEVGVEVPKHPYR